MRTIGTLLIACIALAVVKAALAFLLVVMVIAIIWATCFHPREMFGLAGFFALLGAISAHPIESLCAMGAVVIAAHLAPKDG